MKRNDDFLRDYRTPPRRAFSEGLYKKLSNQKSFAFWLRRGAAWGVMVLVTVYGLSSNLLAFNAAGLASPTAESAAMASARQESLASVGEQGLMAREFTPPPAEDDRLGPFDRPQITAAYENEVVSRELAVVIVPAVYR